ncbi:EAL domain-containing protein [Desulfoluna spongiiphila]|uniref:Diguanylate cyclase/phosphodiesterase n=1 Tax=Desulfoluna spongiiphila TaxID=419481 RepID=A0A1G5IYY0_9BACT|nr:EAL domain-containing protein [Desulfoluna spongiiphila]SCY81227.1 diguanylate cyclase/phosphodiesterase [Desulfoluna spongiiphila]
MSLFRQIQVLITVVLVIMLSIVMKINFDRARDFTGVQLYTGAKNTANVLALSLSSAPADEGFMKSAVNAMFDGGYYERIELVRADGRSSYERHETVRVEGVPAFFIRLVSLDTPVAEARVMNGWSIFGTLKVKGHPGHAYMRLWDTFKQLCLTFVLVGGAALLICWLILRFLMRSLTDIRHQAEAISNHEFIINPNLPGTPELKEVVMAMNTMVEKVKAIFDRQLETIRNYQALHFKDPDTGVYNRSYFVKQLGHFLESESGGSVGAVLILSLDGIDRVGLSGGHPVMHRFYCGLVEMMGVEAGRVPEHVIARLSPHEFGVILPGCLREDALAISDAIIKGAHALTSGHVEFKGVVTFCGGLATYGAEDRVGSLLSKADYALSVSKSGAPWMVKPYSGGSAPGLSGKYEWKRMLEDAFEADRFPVDAQPVVSASGELHREVYVSLVDGDGVLHKAGQFMPMVITLGFAARLDRYVLDATAAQIARNRHGVFAVNLTREFCRDRESFLWLRRFLSSHLPVKNRLVFEFQEATLLNCPEICMDLAGLFRGMGYGFGLDQCTVQDASLNLLKDLKPDYMKVDADYLADAGQNGASDVALNALATIADSLGIRLVASKIETEDQKKMLEKRNIRFFQGRAIAEIEPLGSPS